MKFITTRAGAPVSSAEAIVRGIAPDGALYVPEGFPPLSPSALAEMADDSYNDVATKVLAPYLTDFSAEELSEISAAAYGCFADPAVAPLREIGGGLSLLELFHGPTQAFKDMALQMLPRLLAASRKKVGEAREIRILTATSGDTGKAALCGFKDVPGVRVDVFYPDGGVSEVQKRQMTTQDGENLRVFAVRGNFDDAQREVKRIFADEGIRSALDKKGAVLSSANSINLGRLVPQIVYYVYAYAGLVKRGRIAEGDKINVCVPTGNFGNILAAYYAMRMGLPIGRLISASNQNNVLFDFIGTGIYDKNRPFTLTGSPSMDILVSSNLERLLFELSDRDGAAVGAWMEALSVGGRYDIGSAAHARLSDVFCGGWTDDVGTREAIRRAYIDRGVLIDPHTAVALSVCEAYRRQTGDARETVVVSTASPFKFPSFVLSALTDAHVPGDEFEVIRALSDLTGTSAPRQILELPSRPVLHRGVIEIESMKDIII